VGGEKIRKTLGGIRSASFAVECYRGSDELPVVFLIWGAGWGPQVGMCQVGAAGLADKGWDYRSILSKYYRGCQVERRY
jgi:stage II sporulation protein D